MWPLIRSVSVHRQLTSLYSPESYGRPLVTSTSEPSHLAPLLPDHAPHSAPLPLPLCLFPVPLPDCWKHAASRQTRQRLTDIHTHKHPEALFTQHGPDTELDPRSKGHPGSAGCGRGGTGVCKCVYAYMCVFVPWCVLSS